MNPNPPAAGSEKESLVAFLDRQRDVMLWKVENIDDALLRKPMTPSGITLLGILKHVSWVEVWWFRTVFLAEPDRFAWSEEDPNADWRIEPNETTEQIVNEYRNAIERSNAVVAGANLDDLAAMSRSDERKSLRWIVLHMIEETARHAGHADILREALDGARGYVRDDPM